MRLSVFRSIFCLLCLLPAAAYAQDDSWLGLDPEPEPVVTTPKKAEEVKKAEETKKADPAVAAEAASYDSTDTTQETAVKVPMKKIVLVGGDSVDIPDPNAPKKLTLKKAGQNDDAAKAAAEAAAESVSDDAIAKADAEASKADDAEKAETSDVQVAKAETPSTPIVSNSETTSAKKSRININEEVNPADHDEDKTVIGHGMGLSMSFVGVPSGIIDSFADKHGDTWDGVVNMGFSLDYTMRFKFPMELKLALSWTSFRTGDAYWLEDAAKPATADYVVNNLGMIALEAAVYHIIPIYTSSDSALNEIDFYYGGGLWGGFFTGNVEAHAIDSVCAVESDWLEGCSHSPSSHKATGLPVGFGFVEATVGFKFTLLDHMTIRAEGGFKGYFYGQLGVGVQF